MTWMTASAAAASATLKAVATRYGYRADVDHADATATASAASAIGSIYYAETMDAAGGLGLALLTFGGADRIVPSAADASATLASAALSHYGKETLSLAHADSVAAATARLTKQSVLYLAKQALGIGMAQDVYTAPSLVVGSDALGWMDLAADAVLETMTKAMPGGDGSLEWTLAGDAVERYRNVLVPGAKVRLRLGGVAIWGGRLANDPVRERITTEDTIRCVAGGLMSWAARCQVYGYAGVDSDEEQLFRTSSEYDGDELVGITNSGKFTVTNEGYVLIQGEDDRTFSPDAEARVSYWLHGGLDLGQSIYAVSYSYKCYLPTAWRFRVYGRTDPWSEDRALEEYYNTSASSWTASGLIPLSFPRTCVQWALVYTGATSQSPATAPYVKVRNVKLYCRLDGVDVQTELTAGEAMADVAGELAEVVECDSLTEPLDHVMVRCEPPLTMADALRDLAGLANHYVESYFYLTDEGLDGFRANLRTTEVNEQRNTVWDYGGRAGESLDELQRDAETAPDYLRLFYQNEAADDTPKGTLRDVWYPSDPDTFDANVLAVTDYAEVPLSDAGAAFYAERIWTERQAAQWSGTVNFTNIATTTGGRAVPSWLVRPGDRLSAPGLAGADNLYISETTYDFATATLSAEVGHPWDSWSVAGAYPARHGRHPGPGYSIQRPQGGGLW